MTPAARRRPEILMLLPKSFRIPPPHLLPLVGALLLMACSPNGADRQLVVGMELGYPPFEMKDPQGRPAGVSVDLARALAEHLGRELRIQEIAFDGLIPALKTGRIDVIISSLTATSERAQSISFSEPYLETGLCLLVAKDSPIHSITNLDHSNRTVVVKKGTTGHAFAAASLRQARLLVLDRAESAVVEVVQGKADALIYDRMSIFEYWQRNPETTRALLEPFQIEHWAIGIRKGNDALLREVNAFLRHFRESGGFDRLGDRWLADQKEAFQRAGLSFYF
jgi:polar amino acid transport system substrate-binding protein